MKNLQKFKYLLPMGAILLALAACGGNEQQGPAAAPAVGDESPAATNSTGKIRQVVMAKGKLITGQESDEFTPFEETLLDEAGRELEHKVHWDGYGTLVQTQYDDQGHEISKTRYAPDKTGKLEFRYAWSADFLSLKIEEFSARESRVVASTEKVFDAKGNVVEEKDVDMHLLEYPIEHKLVIHYDAEGRKLSETEYFEGKEYPGAQYSYDKKGRLEAVARMDSEGNISQREAFEYNDQGLKTARYLTDFSAFYKDKQLQARYEYDAKGNMTKEIHYSGLCNDEGRAAGKCPISQTIQMTYDAQGRLLTKHVQRQSPSEVDMELKYEYKPE